MLRDYPKYIIGYGNEITYCRYLPFLLQKIQIADRVGTAENIIKTYDVGWPS
jgi:hypothetical protein